MEKIKIGASVRAKENIGLMKKGDCGIVLGKEKEQGNHLVIKITSGEAKGQLQFLDNYKLEEGFDIFNISEYISEELLNKFPILKDDINRKDILDFFIKELTMFLNE
ncbi:hypothetical protein [Clostridium fallax]|uniref:Uncharacterized protein n=1 Tax=Clostridium fallax TaxID=1533 RepID=A0A1M4XGU5_9CLOT|nr:hypothetical protein [Clostridium fallax]SHE92897.1 hypothetical protein SAMN05443638_11838 [Clostridium fallax]SQB06392.1 Uncharacterised protein [Clostridium fallax]